MINRITQPKIESILGKSFANVSYEEIIKRKKRGNMGKFNFTFVDLFAGIGGFHQAMKYLGGECVMASEIDEACKETYKQNFKVKKLFGDIRKIEAHNVPPFDVLCAGFPCQPFSKAGNQEGFMDKTRGNLFYVILNILDEHKEVKYILLENVRNLADKSQNWDIIKKELMARDFYITEDPIILSPSDFGIPQVRERVYILGIRKDIRNEKILKNGYIHRTDLKLEEFYSKCFVGDAWKILEKNVDEKYRISQNEELILSTWEDLCNNIDVRNTRPIWVQYFGIGIINNEEYFKKTEFEIMPEWKKKIVMKNRNLYLSNKTFIDKWLSQNDLLSKSKLYQKFEWNCGNEDFDFKNSIIQIRQSGIRFKRSNYFPALVAMVNTPIIWDKERNYFRRITPREAANLQSYSNKFKFNNNDHEAMKQLGNSVNVRVLKILGERLFSLGKWGGQHGEKD